jgi:dipeptidyl-peptidase-4
MTLGVALVLSAGPALAQQKRLTIDDLFDPERSIDFGGAPPQNLSWIDDHHYHWPKTDAKARLTEHFRVDALTGAVAPLFEAAKLEADLVRVARVSAEEARRLARQRSYVMDARRTSLVVAAADDLYLFDFGAGTLRRLTSAPGAEDEPGFSPDGRRVAFVRRGNLHVVDAGGGHERTLTSDGSAEVLDGKLDWVYQEEIYGRGNFKGYWWSPDGTRIAFLQLRESKVPVYPVVDDVSSPPTLETERYPRAGDPNPEARLGIVSVNGGAPRWVDLSRYAGAEPLIVSVAWAPDGRRVLYQVQDRIQTWLDLDEVTVDSLRTRTLFRETTQAWVEPQEDGLQFLKDGSFLWLSERTGWKHVYHYAADGTLVAPVTRGAWEARVLHGLDPATGWVYFSGTERSAVGSDVYRVRLDGSGLERLSKVDGTHTASFNPPFALFLDTWSDAATPPQVRLHHADGTEARVIDRNPVPALREYALAQPELLEVTARDGFRMPALLLKPPDFDPAKRYPVYQHTYGGPHAPQVKNAWGGATYLFHQMLAQKGVVVWICDNRTASGKGAASAWPLYKNFGELELRDIEDGLDWLAQKPWVDASRIGINGWSYGGFMVTYALTHSRRFAMGIAGGSVTDWRNYDSVYTERYMDVPARNESGYKKSSPRFAAKDLHGRLLLIHGAIDDNVHPGNTMQLAYELQKVGRPFRLMLYPKSRHGVTEPALVKHLRASALAWIEETLLGAPAETPSPSAAASSH